MTLFEQEFSRRVLLANDLESLKREFSKYMQHAGVNFFSYHIVKHSCQKNLENYYITDYPVEWQDRYIQQNYFDTDPLLIAYQKHSQSFTWGNRDGVTNKTALNMFHEAHDFGLSGGIAIPIPGPLNSFSVLTLSTQDQNQNEIQKINQESGKDLTIAALLFHAGVLSLNLNEAMHYQHELTNKESEYLKWICSGKSYSEIGMIFSVSESAIKKKAANIYSKLGVSTKHEAILKTLKYKVVEV